jgi:hypothetical protein
VGTVIIKYPGAALPFSYDADMDTVFIAGYTYHILLSSGVLLT